MIKPRPMHYQCPNCGWQAITAPKSDALQPGDTYTRCPKCGHQPLEVREAGAAEAMVSSVASVFFPKN